MKPQGGPGASIADDIRGAQAYFRALQRDLDIVDLKRACISRLVDVAEAARERIDNDRVLRDAPPYMRVQLLGDTAAIKEVAYARTLQDRDSESYWGREALEDALQNQAERLARDRAEYKRLVEVELAKMSPGDVSRLLRVIREIVNGLSMSGIEQGECLRTARIEVQDLVIDAGGDKNPIGWLLQGWLHLWTSATSGDASSHFSRGLALVADKRGLLAHLLYRFRAIALDAAGKPGDALIDAKAALPLHSSPDLAFEASRYAIQCNCRNEARRYLEEAIRLEPLSVFVALADPEMTSLEKTILASYASAQTQVRQSAVRMIDDWQALVKQVHAAEKLLGAPLELPSEFCAGFDEMRGHAAKSSLLENYGVRCAARSNTVDLAQLAVRRVAGIHAKRVSDADSAQQIVDTAVKKKATVAQRAQEQAEVVIDKMEADMRRSVSADDQSLQGCSTALGGAFAMFMAYVVVAGFLTQRGVDTGWDSPVGMLGACLIAAPIAIGIGANVAGGLKRATVGCEVERRANHARAKAKVALVEVEKICGKQAEMLLAEAASLHQRTKLATEALRLVKEAPQVANIKPEDQEALPQAA